MILEVKFADDSLFNLWRFKQIHIKSTTWRNKAPEADEIRNKFFVGCYAPWLEDGVDVVANIGVNIVT